MNFVRYTYTLLLLCPTLSCTGSTGEPGDAQSNTAQPGSNTGDGGVTSGGEAGVPRPTEGGVPGPGPSDLDPTAGDGPSLGGTLTMQNIGAPGWYPSRRDPASGQCDAINDGQCCMTQKQFTDDKLSPWDEELILTLRGPMIVKQLAVYQPGASTAAWDLVSAWDDRSPLQAPGIRFDGNGTETTGFKGAVGTECLVDVMLDAPYPCGPGSEPFCPSGSQKYYGWGGSKLFVLLATMPHAADPAYQGVKQCSNGPGGNWYDAPWLGLSQGELVRSGKFGGCHCYGKDPAKWYLADGCGQFNVFEVVNDNNQYANLDLFSTNLFAYHGYVGEGPCGNKCDVSGLGREVDLVNKATSKGAASGAITTPSKGPGAAFRRPTKGYRYFIILLDVESRAIQLGLVHPQAIPSSLKGVLPALPSQLERGAIDAMLQLRLPQ